MRNRNILYLNIILFNINLLALVVCYTIEFIVPDTEVATLHWNEYISQLLCSLFIYILPRFSHSALSLKSGKKLNLFFLLISAILIILKTISRFVFPLSVVTLIIYICMLTSIAYSMIILLHPGVGTKGTLFHKRTAIISLVSLPLLFFIDKLPASKYWNIDIQNNFVIFPIFYIILNIDLILILRKTFWSRNLSISNFINRYSITPRESEVLLLLIEGESYKSIGERLHISISTVKTHINSLYKKTSTANKIELISNIQKQAD